MKTLRGIDSVFFNDDGVFTSEEGVRLPFSYVLTAIQGIGMIINLKKTIISDCNIFCEDYFVPREEISYKKIQNLLIPFANVYFKDNIVLAKSLFYDLHRGLVGQRVYVENLIPSLSRVYGFEFHNSEYWWPFELGGWRYFGDTSVNEVIRSLFHWEDYCPDEERGSVPLFRRWASYLIFSQEVRKLCKGKSNIPYKRFVPNPFKDWKLKYPHSEDAEKWISLLGIKTNPERVSALDDLYNLRGMKNAKPNIKLGKAKKLAAYRISIWRQFKVYRPSVERTLQREPADLWNSLKYFRSEELAPQMYLPPEFMVLNWIEYKRNHEIPLGRVLMEDEATPSSANSRGLFKAIESIFDGYLHKDARPDALRDELSRSKNRSIISNYTLYDFEEDCSYPDWLYLFLPKKRFALILFFSKRIGIPQTWNSIPDHTEVYSALRKPIEKIFPQSAKLYRRVMDFAFSRKISNEVLEIIHSQEYRSGEDLNLALEFVLDHMPDPELCDPSPLEEDDGLDDLTPDDLEIEFDFADDQLGEKTDLDLIEEFDLELEPAILYDDEVEYDWSFEEEPDRMLLASLKEASEERGRNRT